MTDRQKYAMIRIHKFPSLILRKNITFFLLFIGLSGWLILQWACNSSKSTPKNTLGPLRTITLQLGDAQAEIEVAIAPGEQEQGLMYRDSMPENHGMLFVYSQPEYLRFWMKNTKIPLSIAFIREDGIISNIEDMKPYTGPLEPVERYVSREKSLYALEMNQGWFARHGVHARDTIKIPTETIRQMR